MRVFRLPVCLITLGLTCTAALGSARHYWVHAAHAAGPVLLGVSQLGP